MVREATDICLRVLKEINKSRFDSFSRYEQCIYHIPYYLSGLSRAHFFRQPFSKQLYVPLICVIFLTDFYIVLINKGFYLSHIVFVFIFSGLGELEHFLNKEENSHNPFLENSSPKTSLLDLAVEILTTITSRRNPRKYALPF